MINYVPILKWKRAEQRALQELTDKSGVRPLLELVMPTVSLYKKIEKVKVKKTPDEMTSEIVNKFKQQKIIEIPEEILKSWGKSEVYVDFTLLHDPHDTIQLKLESIDRILHIGIEKGLNLIPVVNLNDDKRIKEAICELSGKHNLGLCLRITQSDLTDVKTLNEKIDAFLLEFNLGVATTDLLIDIKAIDGDIGQYSFYFSLGQKIENLINWKHFIFTSGAFPENLNDCKFEELTPLPRVDWQYWLNARKNKHVRMPIFSDYTIRNPVFKEALQYFDPTTSIKYTHEDNWLIMKGKKRKFDLYLANANLLVGSKYYYGSDFSWGDAKISEKADYFKKYIKEKLQSGTGSNEDWIAWCINHHMMLVLFQIANLPVPSVTSA